MLQATRSKAWALLLLAAAAPVAAADTAELFKCVDAVGVTSIQSEPCAKGSTQVWRRDATPEPPPTPEQAAQAQARRERDQRAVRELSADLQRTLKPRPTPAPATTAATAGATDAATPASASA